MEDVQLRVEAFEYLQLPFVIKEGSVGRLKLQVRTPGSCCLSAVQHLSLSSLLLKPCDEA